MVAKDSVFSEEKSKEIGKVEAKAGYEKQKIRDKVKSGQPSKNGRNHPKTSKYIGVSHVKRYGKTSWRARIGVDKKSYHLKSSQSEIECAEAYDMFIVKHNLDKPLNFPNKNYKNKVKEK